MKRSLRMAVLSTIALLPPLGDASAVVDQVLVKDSGPLGMFGGRQYAWVSADMEGTVTREDGATGHYRVPISLYYPDRDSNGFGFVDVVNNADFTAYTDERAPYGRRSVSYTGQNIFSDFLRRDGFTYISVQWSRTTTELLGPDYGIIEDGTDGYEIIRDAVGILRRPEVLSAELPTRPEAVQWVIGHGQSQGAGVLRGLVWLGENRGADSSLIFDGLLLTGHNGEACAVLNNDASISALPGRPSVPRFLEGGFPCPEPLPDAPKIMTLRTQTEPERAGSILSRPDVSGYRVYEIAGVSHVPVFGRNLSTIGATRQNPASWRPVAKAMLRHLVDWVANGTEPPPPLYLEASSDEAGRFSLVTDEDGNVFGGIRLPHMPTLLPNGERAGAPLGLYGGFDPTLDRALGYGYAELGGIFEPFSPEELLRRYPTREAYGELVRNAAEALLGEGYILEEDHDAYIREAEQMSGWWPVTIGP